MWRMSNGQALIFIAVVAVIVAVLFGVSGVAVGKSGVAVAGLRRTAICPRRSNRLRQARDRVA